MHFASSLIQRPTRESHVIASSASTLIDLVSHRTRQWHLWHIYLRGSSVHSSTHQTSPMFSPQKTGNHFISMSWFMSLTFSLTQYLLSKMPSFSSPSHSPCKTEHLAQVTRMWANKRSSRHFHLSLFSISSISGVIVHRWCGQDQQDDSDCYARTSRILQ